MSFLLLVATSILVPQPSPSPGSTPTPAPEIRRLFVTPRPSGTPDAAGSAPASPEPTGLPHYVQLGPLEQAQVDRLVDELARADALIAKHQYASARVLLKRARREADAAQRQLVVLGLYPSWTEPRVHLDELDKQISDAWAQGPDPESLRLVEAAKKRVEVLLVPLERTAKTLPAAELERQSRAAREQLEQEGLAQELAGNPAWHRVQLGLERRLDALSHLQELRQGTVILADEIAHMVELDASARRRLAAGDYDGALGDYAALEEACNGFKHDLTELQALGFNPAALRLNGVDGDRQGRSFLGRVDHWLLDAHRRYELVAEARDPWRHALTGDRLRVYTMLGLPTWPGAPEQLDVADAARQPLWIFYEPVRGQPHQRLRHEYRFIGDHLQHHELFREQI